MSTAEMINHELAACWEMCCEAVGIDTDATAAEWRETYDAQLAGERRKAKIEELRRLAQEIAKAPITVLAIYSEADGAYVDGMGNARKAIVKAIQDRADRMESENEQDS